MWCLYNELHSLFYLEKISKVFHLLLSAVDLPYVPTADQFYLFHSPNSKVEQDCIGDSYCLSKMSQTHNRRNETELNQAKSWQCFLYGMFNGYTAMADVRNLFVEQMKFDVESDASLEVVVKAVQYFPLSTMTVN
jgi:hypothetical protein